jgi:hypothetical protein
LCHSHVINRVHSQQPTFDRCFSFETDTPMNGADFGVTVCCLGEPDCHLVLAIEGGHQNSSSVFLVFSPKWIEKRNTEIYLHKVVRG